MNEKIEIEYLEKCLHLNVEIDKKENGILVVGDLHLGYEEILNKSGVFVTREMFSEMILYFDSVFDRLDSKGKKVNEIILLGDVKHGFGKSGRQEWKDVLELFEYFERKMKENLNEESGRIVIVKGNHDNYIANVAGKRGVEVLDSYLIYDGAEEKIGFCHGDKKIEGFERDDVVMWIMGHGHPAIRIRDREGKEETYKCFLVGEYSVGKKFAGHKKKVIIVPSFIDYKRGTDPRENDMKLGWDFDLKKFNVKIVSVGDEENLEVLDFGKLGNIS